MPALTLPDPADAKAVIADYLAVLPFDPSIDARREQIINNCVKPITLLIQALELAGAAGPTEEAVMIQFIRALYAQAEMLNRKKHLADLMQKLTSNRRLH